MTACQSLFRSLRSLLRAVDADTQPSQSSSSRRKVKDVTWKKLFPAQRNGSFYGVWKFVLKICENVWIRRFHMSNLDVFFHTSKIIFPRWKVPCNSLLSQEWFAFVVKKEPVWFCQQMDQQRHIARGISKYALSFGEREANNQTPT